MSIPQQEIAAESRAARIAAVGIVLAAGIYRLALTRLYYGSEEEDYGNLGLILGTLQSGFTYIETEHMPLFTSCAAVLAAGVGDAELAGELLAVTMGTATVAIVTWIGWHWFRPSVGLLAGALLAFQPDAALYSATPLRISTYSALSLAGVALVGQRRTLAAAACLSLAFLTRFDLAFTVLPALLVWAALKRDRRAATTAGLVAGVVAAWAAYYRSAEGTFAFWGEVAGRSTEGGDALLHLDTLGQVLLRVVPNHLGFALALAAPLGLVAILKNRRTSPEAWLALVGCAVFGFFCLTVALSSYGWDHNLFWKWLVASLPYGILLASFALLEGLRKVAPATGGLLALLAAASIAIPWVQGTRDQLDRSSSWYGTQVHMMRWVEKDWPADVRLLADLIPATYLSRKASERSVQRWSQEDVPAFASPAELGEWLVSQEISLVFSFDEEWVGSQHKAPWLHSLRALDAGPVRLTPVARQDEYGVTAWQVTGPAIPARPSAPPPPAAGALPRPTPEPR